MSKHITLEEFDPGAGLEWNAANYPHSGWYWIARTRQVMYVSKEPIQWGGGGGGGSVGGGPGVMTAGSAWAIHIPPGAADFFSHSNPSVGDIPWVEVLKMIAIIEHPEMAKELLK